MSRRPAARYRPPDAKATPIANDNNGTHAQRAHELRLARAEELDTVLALFDAKRELYCVEVAAACGVTVNRAATRLQRLEVEGMLESRLAPSPNSGHGRRYYRRS